MQDKVAESGVIATLIEHPDLYFQCDWLTPHDFYDTENGYIYYALSEIAKAKIPHVDSYNIINQLNKREDVKKSAKDITPQKLDELIDLCKTIKRDTPEEYEALCNNVSNMSKKRKAYQKIKKCESLILNDTNNEYQVQISAVADEILSDGLDAEKVQYFGDNVESLWEEIESRREKDGCCGLPSKFPSAQKYFTYESAELVMVAAHRKEGKSMFCLNEMYDKMRKGYKILYIDTELSSRQHFERLLACICGIEVSDIKNGNYTFEQGETLKKAREWLKSQTYIHKYMPIPDVNTVYRLVKKLKNANQIDFLIYDYIKSQNSKTSEDSYNALGNIADFLKNRIAGELNIPVLAAAQLNRGGEIGDSYKLEQFCSVMCILKRKTSDEWARDGQSCGNYKLFVKLNRLGEQMDNIEEEYIDLEFQGNLARFKEAQEQHKIEKPF